jgi:Ca-activated chloride channel homolog
MWSFLQETAAMLAVVGLLMAALYLLKKPQKYPYIQFSSLISVDQKKKPHQDSSRKFYVISLMIFALAWADFHFERPWQKEDNDQKTVATEGIAIYLALDRSGSMIEKIRADMGEGDVLPVKKIDFLKQITKDFILGNAKEHLLSLNGDMVGLVTFARTATVLCPLTLDYNAVVRQLEKIQVVTDPQEDGTAIGYAVDKITDIIVATKQFGKELSQNKEISEKKIGYEIKGAAIIVVTDGFQTINPDDMNNSRRTIDIEQAAAHAAKEKIKLYIITIDPQQQNPNFEVLNKSMNRSAEVTGGRHYVVTEPSDLKNIYQEINKIEKSVLVEELKVRRPPEGEQMRSFSFFPMFIFMGLSSLCMGFLYETLWQRRVP